MAYAVFAELTVSLTEDDANDLANAEEPDALRQRILSQIPESGFLSISTAGDMSLIKRHQQALRQLQEQGGYAPYLTDYLFEAAQVSVPGVWSRLRGGPMTNSTRPRKKPWSRFCLHRICAWFKGRLARVRHGDRKSHRPIGAARAADTAGISGAYRSGQCAGWDRA